MVVVERGKCRTLRKKEGGIVHEGNVREKYVRGNMFRGNCPDPDLPSTVAYIRQRLENLWLWFSHVNFSRAVYTHRVYQSEAIN